jgi:hypothetical protein
MLACFRRILPLLTHGNVSRRSLSQRRWKCKDCHKQFSVTVGAILEDSPIKLEKWLVALLMFVNYRNGVSSYEIARALGMTQKSAWGSFCIAYDLLHTQSIWVSSAVPMARLKRMRLSLVGKPRICTDHRARLHKAEEACLHGDTRLIGKAAVMGIMDRQQRKVRATVISRINAKRFNQRFWITSRQDRKSTPMNRSSPEHCRLKCTSTDSSILGKVCRWPRPHSRH